MLCCSPLSASKDLLKVPQLHWRQQRKHTVTAASVVLSFIATCKDFMIIMPPDDVQEVFLKSSGSEHLSAVISDQCVRGLVPSDQTRNGRVKCSQDLLLHLHLQSSEYCTQDISLDLLCVGSVLHAVYSSWSDGRFFGMIWNASMLYKHKVSSVKCWLI